MVDAILIIGVIIVALIAVVGVMLFKPNLGSFKQTSYPQVVNPTSSATTSELEVELNSEVLTDPSGDFKEVDKDITSLQ